MTALFVLPAIDPKVTGYLLRSLHPSIHERLFLIDNSKTGIPWRKPGVTVHREGRNIGVSRAWNMGVRLAGERGDTSVILLSGNVRFGKLGGTDLYDLALGDGPSMHAPAPCHWHTVIFRLSVFERVGMFDQGTLAYYEDADMGRRLELAGIEQSYEGTVDARIGRDGHGSDRLRHDHPGLPTLNHEAMAERWTAKWNVPIAVALDITQGHRTPWGLDVGLDYWPAETLDELHARYGTVG